jgi:mannosyltransferase
VSQVEMRGARPPHDAGGSARERSVGRFDLQHDAIAPWKVLGFFCAAAALNIFRLDSQLMVDEVWTLDAFIRKPFLYGLTTYDTDNNHPLYTALAWICVRAFGESAWALRLPAALFGAGAVAMLYVFGARTLGRVPAALAAGVLALAYHQVWYAQNARGYSALLFLTLLSSDALLRVLHGAPGRPWITHGTALALGVFTHVSGVFLGAAHLVIVLYASAKSAGVRARWRQIGAGFLTALVTALVLLAGMLGDMLRFFTTRRVYFGAEPEWRSPLWALRAAAQSLGIGEGPGLAVIGGALAVALIGCVAVWKRRPAVVLLAVLPAALGAGAFLALGRNLWPRFFFFIGGFAALIVVEGLLRIAETLASWIAPDSRAAARRALVIGGFALVFAGELWVLRGAYLWPKQDFEGAKRYAVERRGAGEPVLATGLAANAYRDYYGGDFTVVMSAAELDAALAGHREALLIYLSPIHLASWNPALWEAITSRGAEEARFRGTAGPDQDLVVTRIRAR